MAENPWAFGWTHLLSILQIIVTVVIAFFGFQTFRKWKREKIEEQRILLAADALRLAYQARPIFDYVRNGAAFDYEAKERPKDPNETPEETRRRDTFFSPILRLHKESQYFVDIQSIRPKIMAFFGADKSDFFDGIIKARANVLVAAQMLSRENYADQAFSRKLHSEVWKGYVESENDEVGKLIEDSIKKIEDFAQPILRH